MHGFGVKQTYTSSMNMYAKIIVHIASVKTEQLADKIAKEGREARKNGTFREWCANQLFSVLSAAEQRKLYGKYRRKKHQTPNGKQEIKMYQTTTV